MLGVNAKAPADRFALARSDCATEIESHMGLDEIEARAQLLFGDFAPKAYELADFQNFISTVVRKALLFLSEMRDHFETFVQIHRAVVAICQNRVRRFQRKVLRLIDFLTLFVRDAKAHVGPAPFARKHRACFLQHCLEVDAISRLTRDEGSIKIEQFLI